VQVVAFQPRLGEIVAAWVRLRPGQEATEEEIRGWCQGQIAYYKVLSTSASSMISSHTFRQDSKVQDSRV